MTRFWQNNCLTSPDLFLTHARAIFLWHSLHNLMVSGRQKEKQEASGEEIVWALNAVNITRSEPLASSNVRSIISALTIGVHTIAKPAPYNTEMM